MAGLTEVLGGLVDRVTFHNTENGFCVLRVKARGQVPRPARYPMGQMHRVNL